MRKFNVFLGTLALLVAMAFAPAAKAQVSFGVNIGGAPPNCPFGYYDYAPYACAPQGYYGPGYFSNGIFLGVGPWAGWGYGHGWGHRRFHGERGGRYHGHGGWDANHGHWAHGGYDHGDHH